MNWLKKIFNLTSTKIQESKDDAELKASNWGRSFDWYIEMDGQIIGELVDGEFDDMFWFRYKIVAHLGFEQTLFEYESWLECDFKFKNKHYQQYADHAICGPEIEENEGGYSIIMRGLQLDFIVKSYV